VEAEESAQVDSATLTLALELQNPLPSGERAG